MQSFEESALNDFWNALIADPAIHSSSTIFVISRTAGGRLKISPSIKTEPGPNFRLLKDSGAQFLLKLGIEEGDTVDEDIFSALESEGHMYPVPGTLSRTSFDLPWDVRRRLTLNGIPLNVTNRTHANRLGWREDVTGVRRRGPAKARELAFAESSQELYFRVYSSDMNAMVTYHLVESAVPILLEHGIMVGDEVDHELQYSLFIGGHLYTEASGQTGY